MDQDPLDINPDNFDELMDTMPWSVRTKILKALHKRQEGEEPEDEQPAPGFLEITRPAAPLGVPLYEPEEFQQEAKQLFSFFYLKPSVRRRLAKRLRRERLRQVKKETRPR